MGKTKELFMTVREEMLLNDILVNRSLNAKEKRNAMRQIRIFDELEIFGTKLKNDKKINE